MGEVVDYEGDGPGEVAPGQEEGRETVSLSEQAKEFDNMVPFQKVRAVAIMKEHEEEYKKLDVIRNDFDDRGYRINDIANINDVYQIVEYEIRVGKKWKRYFAIYIGFKRTRHHELTFDRALIAALAIKYDGHSTTAPMYIAKMLGMPEESR
jgi:hypothetical protein